VAKVKFDKAPFETKSKYKKTSIGRNPSKAMMNKSKRRNFKKYVGQGKAFIRKTITKYWIKYMIKNF
jgi:hypothetical protein